MLPDIWPGYQGMSEPCPTVIPPRSSSGHIWVSSSSPWLAVNIESALYPSVARRWSPQKHTGDRPARRKLSEHVALYSASEVHEVTQLKHDVQQQQQQGEKNEACRFTLFAQII